MTKQITPPTPNEDEKVKVLVNLGVSDPDKADVVAKALGFDSRSAYLRNRIRRDYVRVIRRQQADLARA